MDYDYSFSEDVKIYDTDAQGIVHYSGYYRFFTDAMQEFIKFNRHQYRRFTAASISCYDIYSFRERYLCFIVASDIYKSNL